MIAEITSTVAEWLTAVTQWMVSAFQGIVEIFYNASATDGPKLTVYGILLLFGIAFGLVMFGFRFIRSLIRK